MVHRGKPALLSHGGRSHPDSWCIGPKDGTAVPSKFSSVKACVWGFENLIGECVCIEMVIDTTHACTQVVPWRSENVGQPLERSKHVTRQRKAKKDVLRCVVYGVVVSWR